MANRGEKVASEELSSCSRPDLAAAAFGGGASGPSAAPEGRAMGEIAQDISVGAPLADPYASAPPAADPLLRDGYGSVLQVGPPMREIGAILLSQDLLGDAADVLSLGPHLDDDDDAAAAAYLDLLTDPAPTQSASSAAEMVVLTSGGATPSVVEALGDTFSLGREIKEDHPDYLVVTTKARVRVDNGKPGRQLRKGASIRRGGFVGAKDGQIHPTF